MNIGDFVRSRSSEILFASFQHFSLVAQSVVLATVIAVVVAALVHRSETGRGIANAVSAVGLTIPSFALIGLMVAPFGFGVAPAVVVIVFFAALPILRNAVVGLANVDPALVESARGLGMGRLGIFLRVELRWPGR